MVRASASGYQSEHNTFEIKLQKNKTKKVVHQSWYIYIYLYRTLNKLRAHKYKRCTKGYVQKNKSGRVQLKLPWNFLFWIILPEPYPPKSTVRIHAHV